MAVRVVDSSAVAAVVFGEPEGPEVAERIRGHQLVAPGLLPYEVANVCVTKARRHSKQSKAILQAHALWPALGVRLVDVDMAEVASLALSTKLTAYDAAFLWLARRLDAELVTLDTGLSAAATGEA
jgi:predicted nucleic acid-binding protein